MAMDRQGYNRILKYMGLLGGVQVLQVLVSVLRNKCAAVFVGTAGMGVADILNRTTDMFSALTNLGIPMSGVRAVAAEREAGFRERLCPAISSIRLLCMITGVAGALLCLLLAGPINALLFNGGVPEGFLQTVSPVILFMSVFGGEAAIMKGCRNLKQLATASVCGATASLVVTVVLYTAVGFRAIPWALLSSSFALMVSALYANRRLSPWSASVFSRRHLAAGKAFVALGLAYVAAGFAGTGAEMLVRAFISHGSVSDVGIYASGFVLCVTYTRIVFVAMDADYFPRLSAAVGKAADCNLVVSRQIDVCVLLIAPMTAALLLFLPFVVRLLYSHEFLGATGMCVWASGFLFLKAVISPIEYLPLARGDSSTYLVMELAYDMVFVALLAAGYHFGGLRGAGLALTLSYLVDLVAVAVVYRRLYGLRLALPTLRIVAVQGAMVAAAFAVFAHGYGMAQYITGALVFACSAFYSIRKLKIKWSGLKEWIRAKTAGKQR